MNYFHFRVVRSASVNNMKTGNYILLGLVIISLHFNYNVYTSSLYYLISHFRSCLFLIRHLIGLSKKKSNKYEVHVLCMH